MSSSPQYNIFPAWRQGGIASRALQLVIGLVTFACAGTAATTDAITPTKPVILFNGRDLSPFYVWLSAHGRSDPNRVCTVVDQIDGAPAIRLSGQDHGGIITNERFKNYHLITEYRWGLTTWRTAKRRNSGVLLHCQGEDGNYRPDFSGSWMRSVEYEILEGATGDMILVGGHERGRPERIHPSIKATVGPGPRVPLWNPAGALTEFGAGKGTRIYWLRKDPDVPNVTGARGRADAEKPAGEWNLVEAICDGGDVTFLLNGEKVNAGIDGTFKEGTIMFQSEGAEIFFRRIELHPLKK